MALSGTISGSYRGYTLQTSWSAVQNISGNYSDITATHKLICASTFSLYISQRTNTCTIDGTSKNFTSSAINTAGGQTITLGTTTQRVYHNANGTKSFAMSTVFNMQATIVGVYVDKITASGTIALNTIPRQATINIANNFNDEQNPSFTFTNAGGFQLSASLTFAGQTITRSGLGNATSGTITFNLTTAERNLLRNSTPNSNTMSVNFNIYSVISGTTFTNSASRRMTIVNAIPTAPTLAYQDTNSTTTAITTNNQRIIQNKSTLRAIIGSGQAKKGASISSYSTTINGVTRAGNGNVDFGTLNIASNMNLICTVTDSRGNTAQVTKEVIVDAWSNPTALIELYRVNNYETSSRLKVDSRYSSLNSKNTITCQYCYKKETDANYSAWANIANNSLITINLDNNYDYNVKVRIKDKISSYIEYDRLLLMGKPIFFIDTIKKTIGINDFPTTNHKINGNIDVDGNISMLGGLNAYGLSINGASIFQTGVTNNGKYIKFSNGVMIQWNYFEVYDQPINSAYGSLYQSVRLITYPLEFADTPSVIPGIFKYGTSASWSGLSETATPTKTFYMRGIDAYSRQTGTICRISWLAIGRWF